MLNTGHVAVVGSANLDIVMTIKRVPSPGETVMGDRYEEVAGGKGANQALAAARSAKCDFVGCIGLDEAGMLIRRQLENGTVYSKHLLQRNEPTGRAFIQVTPDGENNIVVMALANNSLDAEFVMHALDDVRPAVVLAQLEIPYGAVEAAANWAERNGSRFVLNPSPVTGLSAVLLRRCDPLILNAAEAKAIFRTSTPQQSESAGESSVAENAVRIAQLVRSVVVTDGGRGAHVGTASGGIVQVSGKQVKVQDTTGAGDEFAGALAGALANGFDLEAAAGLANDAAARLVQVPRQNR